MLRTRRNPLSSISDGVVDQREKGGGEVHLYRVPQILSPKVVEAGGVSCEPESNAAYPLGIHVSALSDLAHAWGLSSIIPNRTFLNTCR